MAEERLQMGHAGAALPALQIDFQIRVRAGRLGNRGDRGFGEGRAPQVRVEDDAGRIDHRFQARDEALLRAAPCLGRKRFDRGRAALRAAAERVAQSGERLARGPHHDAPRNARPELGERLGLEKRFDRGDRAELAARPVPPRAARAHAAPPRYAAWTDGLARSASARSARQTCPVSST